MTCLRRPSWTESVSLTAGLFRTTNVLKIYRGFETPAEGKLADWMARIFAHPAFKRTCSTEELYLDSYER
jgi:glutathione S-transferase